MGDTLRAAVTRIRDFVDVGRALRPTDRCASRIDGRSAWCGLCPRRCLRWPNWLAHQVRRFRSGGSSVRDDLGGDAGRDSDVDASRVADAVARVEQLSRSAERVRDAVVVGVVLMACHVVRVVDVVGVLVTDAGPALVDRGARVVLADIDVVEDAVGAGGHVPPQIVTGAGHDVDTPARGREGDLEGGAVADGGVLAVTVGAVDETVEVVVAGRGAVLDFEEAGRAAAVTGDDAAVIALLTHGCIQDAVAAGLVGQAVRRAVVAVGVVAVVADLTGGGVEHTIAAGRSRAVGVAGDALAAVVAGLAGGGVEHPVATGRSRAVDVTGGALDAVVTDLAGGAVDVAVAAGLVGETVAAAAVEVEHVAVVADLAEVEHTVAAALELTDT